LSMAKKNDKSNQMRKNVEAATRPMPPAVNRALVSLFAPVAGTIIILVVINNLFGAVDNTLAQSSMLLGGFGIISWFMGSAWYGAKGMGMRGGRPMFAGSGFAFMGWVALLVMRVAFSDIPGFTNGRLGSDFVYLLLFEAFAVQIWTFGFFFRSVADWRGPLTAAFSSGTLFGVIAYLTFLESFELTGLAFGYFLLWGLFYGLVRLRTGSILGIVVTQAMQSLTAWQLLLPNLIPPLQFNSLYTAMGIVYAIFIWRLWPKEESDYRV